jgi:hypothetical protein
VVSPDPDELVTVDELLHICRHLVVLNNVSESFGLAHLTVREYLEDRKEYQDGRPHALVAEQCIKLFEPGVPRGVLDKYASLCWPAHYNSRPQTEDNDTLTNTMKKLFDNKGDNLTFATWAKAAKHSSESLPWGDVLARRLRDADYKPLSVVSAFGFPEVLDQWIDTTPGFSYFRDSVDMVVQLAIKWGSEKVVRFLLQTDTQPTVDRVGWTSSVWAAFYDQKPVLEVLKLLYGDVDAKDEMGWTALHWMVFLGHIEGLRTLVGVGAGPNVIDQAEWTPLHWAAFLDRETEARELVLGGYGLDAKDHDKLTPFQWAKSVGSEETAKHLWTSAAEDSFSPTLPHSGDVRMRGLESYGAFLII